MKIFLTHYLVPKDKYMVFVIKFRGTDGFYIYRDGFDSGFSNNIREFL